MSLQSKSLNHSNERSTGNLEKDRDKSDTVNTAEMNNSSNKNLNEISGQVTSEQCVGMQLQANGSCQVVVPQESVQQKWSQQKLFAVSSQILNILNTTQIENKQLKERCAQLELRIQIESYEKKEQPHSGREQVSRSISAPESNKGERDIHPEVFLFPDNKHKQNNKSRSSDPYSEDGLRNSLENSGSAGQDSNEFLGLKDSFHEPPGVSTQYFNNAINELLKVKTYLYNLQQKQKCEGVHVCENQMEKMRCEIRELWSKNQDLERELAKKDEEMAKVRQEPTLTKDESFELSTETEAEAELSESLENGGSSDAKESLEEELQRLREENEKLIQEKHKIIEEKEELHKMLMKDNHEINRELMQLNDAYNRRKEDVKILHSCLQEEKARSKTKTEETRKLSAQLGSLRQKYEELREEKNALEKTRSLEDTPSVRYMSPRSQIGSSEFNRSGGSNRSGEYSRFSSNRSSPLPFTSRNESYNIRPENWIPRLNSQNNLSSGENEPKLSNIPQFGDVSSPKYKCPRCLRRFVVENSYLLHLEACLD